MLFDIRSIFITVSILCCLTAIALFFSLSRRFRKNGELEWTIGQFCHGIAWGLFGLREIIPDLFSIVLANTLLTASYCLFYGAIRKLDGHAYRWHLLFLPSLMTALLFSFAWGYIESVHPRVIYMVLVSCLQLGFIASTLLRGNSGQMSRFRRFTGWVFIAAALIWLIQLGEMNIYADQENHLLDANPLQLFVLMLGGGITVLASLGFLLMIRERTEIFIQTQSDSLQNVINNVPLIMMLVDKKGCVRGMNAAALAAADPKTRDLTNRLCGDLLGCVNALRKEGCGRTPDCLECTLRNTFEETFSSRKSFLKREGTLTRQGERGAATRHILVSTTHLDLPEGESVLVSVDDITDQKNAQDALRQGEERYRSLFDNSIDAVLLTTPNGRILAANPEACRIFGRTEEELCRIGKYGITDPNDPNVAAALEERARKGKFRGELRFVRKDGASFPGEVSSAIFEGRDGRPMTSMIIRDVAERKRTEEKLQKSEERFRLAYSTSPDAININRMSDGLYEDINDGFTQLTGFTREDVIGRTSREIDIWCDPADRRELIHRLQEKGYCENLEAAFRRKDGSVTTALMSAKIIVFEDVPHILSITRDISDRKRAEEERTKLQQQLLQAQKMESVGRLAGGVAHDFNNMLGVILGHTEMALEEVDPALPLHADLEEIHKAANRSADLTRQLLAFARKQTVSPKVLDLNETVEGMLKMLRRLIGEDIQLAWLPGSDLWPVRMDPSQIDQILANLSVNARDAIAGVGRVTIETKNVRIDETSRLDHTGSAPGEYVQIAVSDDGCGMDEEVLGKLFEPFFTTKGMGKGTGLGLATVYGIVDQNNGFIDVKSEPGRGTAFRIHLPRHSGNVELPSTVGIGEPALRGHETVLLVEDDPALLEMSRFMLEKQGYRVLSAGRPGEAIRLVGECPGEIQLLITDVVMPEMNGRDLVSSLQCVEPNLRHLFMSGYTADVIAHSGVLDEGVHFLPKPFSRKELAAKVREVLDGKQGRES